MFRPAHLRSHRSLAAILATATFLAALAAVHVHDLPAGHGRVVDHGSTPDSLPTDCPACVLAQSPTEIATTEIGAVAPAPTPTGLVEAEGGNPSSSTPRTRPGRGPPVSV